MVNNAEKSGESYKSRMAQKYGIPIVSTSFVDVSFERGELVEPDDFLLVGKTAAEQFYTGKIIGKECVFAFLVCQHIGSQTIQLTALLHYFVCSIRVLDLNFVHIKVCYDILSQLLFSNMVQSSFHRQWRQGCMAIAPPLIGQCVTKDRNTPIEQSLFIYLKIEVDYYFYL